MKTISKLLQERDVAIGAVLLLAFDGVISESRARELLHMTLEEQEEFYMRISGERDRESVDQIFHHTQLFPL